MSSWGNSNKTFVAIVLGALVISAAVYLSPRGDDIHNHLSRDRAIGEVASVKEAIVTKVIDGDTVVIEGGQSVRLLGIDADERGYNCYGAAKERLEELVLGKSVRLIADNEDTDRYGRLLRHLFVGSVNVGVTLTGEGLAIAYLFPENELYRDEIVAAEEEAVAGRLGCKWGGGSRADSPGTVSAEAPVVSACESAAYIGRDVVIEGVVVSTHRSAKDNVFLNFGAAYPDHCFSAVIFNGDRHRFPAAPEGTYGSTSLRISGRVQEYRGKPEIILKAPSQIEVIAR